MIVAWHLGVQDGLWVFLYSSSVVNEHSDVVSRNCVSDWTEQIDSRSAVTQQLRISSKRNLAF